MNVLNETTNKTIEEAYDKVKGSFSSSGSSDFVSYWLSIRDQYHHLGEDMFFALNRKIIREHGEAINS